MAILEDSFYDGQPELDGIIDNEQKLDMTDEWEPIVPRTRNINPIAAQQLPNQEPPRHVVQHILNHVQEEPVDICNTGNPNKDPEGSTKNVVPSVSEVVDTIISVSDSEDDLVTEDAFEEEEVLTGEKAVNGADYTSTQTITAAPKLVDQEISKVVPVIDNQQKLAIEVGETYSNYDDPLVFAPGEQIQDSIEYKLQSVTTNTPTKYDDLLVIPPEEFYERVPWMYHIVSEVEWKQRWCSMSDLDSLRNKMEKEAEEKADQEEQARIAGEQRVLIAERIEERAGHRLVYLMIRKVSHFFILADNKDCPQFTPALNEYSDYSRKCTRGGIRVDVGQYLSKRINNTNDPEKLAFYKRCFYNTMLTYMNTPMITSFVKFMCNKWKTGKTFESKENVFFKEIKQWVESIWRMERSEYLADRRRGASPKWTLKSSYSQYLNIDCPKYYDTDFFKARMQFHLLNDNNDPISDFLGLHYTLLDEQQVNDVILDRDFYFIAKEFVSLKVYLMLFGKAFFMEQFNVEQVVSRKIATWTETGGGTSAPELGEAEGEKDEDPWDLLKAAFPTLSIEKPEEFDTIGPPQLKNTARPTIDAGCLLKNYGRAAFTSCDIIHAYLNSLAEKNLEASVLYSGCAQIKDKNKLKNYVKNLLDKPFIKFVIFALCHDEHWRILKISPEVIEEYDPLNRPIPEDVSMIIQTMQSIHHQPLKRLSKDRTKPKQEDGHNCGPFILGQGREWLIGTPWRRDSVPEMGWWRMSILAQLMDNYDCTNDNKLITQEMMDSYVQTLPPAQNLDQSVADQTPSAQEHGEEVGEATCKGYKVEVAFKDVTINISAEDEFPMHIKIRAGKCKLNATFVDTRESLIQGAHTEETDPVTIQNTQEIENSSASTKTTPDAPEALTEGRKRKLDDRGQPPAKKNKTDIRFALLGVPASQTPTSRKPFSDFLNGHGFDLALDDHVLLHNPLPSRIPKPKFIGLFSIPCKGLEDLILAYLEREDVITNLFLENKRKFGSETSRFKILAVHSDVEEIRIIQFALRLMEVFHENQSLDMFRNVSTMNVRKIKEMLDSTPQQHIYTAYMKFSKAGRREIVNAFRAVTNIPTHFWNQIERMKESNV